MYVMVRFLAPTRLEFNYGCGLSCDVDRHVITVCAGEGDTVEIHARLALVHRYHVEQDDEEYKDADGQDEAQ